MYFFVITKKKPSVIEFEIDTFKNKNITVLGVDNENQKTEYFNRPIIRNGKYIFNLPISPEVLKIIVFENNEGDVPVSDKYNISNFRFSKLPKKLLIVDADTQEFINLAQWFSEKSGYLQPGYYYSKNKKFLINYLAVINEDLKTPSRVHTNSGVIEVSKKWFDEMTVPGRMAILLHEFAHNNLDDIDIERAKNLDIEKNADENALHIYLLLGYPKIEWVNVWSYIFQDYDDHLNRLYAGDHILRNAN